MVVVDEITIRSFDLDHLDIFWKIAPVFGPKRDGDTHEIFDYEFYVLRATDSRFDTYETVAGPLRDIYHVRDSNVSSLNKWRDYFYKIRVVHKPTGNEQLFGPEGAKNPPPDLIAADIIRKEDILFREFIGRRCWLYPLRMFGPYCSCFDPSLRKVTRSRHAPCFGTGFLGGYLKPIEVFIQIDPVQSVPGINAQQPVQHNDTRARMGPYPPVRVGDVVVETENRRWKVSNSGNTQRLRSIVHQELGLHEIPIGDIEHALPIVTDLSTLYPSAPRNFTNPSSLEKHEDYSDIVGFFGTGHPGRSR